MKYVSFFQNHGFRWNRSTWQQTPGSPLHNIWVAVSYPVKTYSSRWVAWTSLWINVWIMKYSWQTCNYYWCFCKTRWQILIPGCFSGINLSVLFERWWKAVSVFPTNFNSHLLKCLSILKKSFPETLFNHPILNTFQVLPTPLIWQIESCHAFKPDPNVVPSCSTLLLTVKNRLPVLLRADCGRLVANIQLANTVYEFIF